MAYIYNIPNMSTGIDEALIDTATAVPIFIPMMLVFVFGVVVLGGMSSQKKRTGFADMPMWVTIASLSTLMICLPMTLSEGLISVEYLGIVVVITLISGVWLFFDRNRNEV